jgi:DNA-binding transcriptional LysR family regulator
VPSGGHRVLLAGAGVALTPRFIVEPDLRTGRLKAVLTDYRTRELSVYVVHPERRHLLPNVRDFVDFVADLMATQLGR